MYLAGILGLCALLFAPSAGGVSGSVSSLARQDAQTPSGSAAQPTSQQAQPEAGTKPPQAPPTPAPAKTSSHPPASSQNPATPKKLPPKKKKPSTTAADAKKTVVRHGSTGEPGTQLAPEMTEEQAAHQRESTKQLLSSTDANLQKLSGQQLNKDQQDTVVQIRKFMEQAKAADAAGDLERASKLAVKAHLLSDALAKP
jgi:outer membrane biosynthesis protein TonB